MESDSGGVRGGRCEVEETDVPRVWERARVEAEEGRVAIAWTAEAETGGEGAEAVEGGGSGSVAERARRGASREHAETRLRTEEGEEEAEGGPG